MIVEGLTKLQRQEVAPATDSSRPWSSSCARPPRRRTLVIKIFDRCDRPRSLEVFGDDKRQLIALETEKFYIPIASRLGFYKQARLEDHVMRVLQPEAWAAIVTWLAREKKHRARAGGAEARDICEQLRAMHIGCSFQLPEVIYAIHQAAGDTSPERLNDGCSFNLLVVGEVDACFRALDVIHASSRTCGLGQGLHQLAEDQRLLSCTASARGRPSAGAGADPHP